MAGQQPWFESNRKRLELDEEPAESHHMQQHGPVDPGDQEAVDNQDGGLRLPEKAGGEHAKEAGRGYWEGGCLHKVLVLSQVMICVENNPK